MNTDYKIIEAARLAVTLAKIQKAVFSVYRVGSQYSVQSIEKEVPPGAENIGQTSENGTDFQLAILF